MKKLSYLNLGWSADWTAIFGVEAPLIVEIGFGNADHLIHLAQTHPDHNIIGIEIATRSMDKAESKIASHGLKNAVAVHATGETALAHLFAPQSVQEFHINYPDPWFKKRHSGRRLIKPETVNMIASRLVTGGKLFLASDIVAYAEMAHEVFLQTPSLTNILDLAWVNEIEGRFRTKYEQKGIKEGRPGNYFVYQRNEQPVPYIPAIKDLEMPHLFLTTPHSASDIIKQFHQMEIESKGVYIKVIEAYANLRNVIFFEINVEEATIDQHTAVVFAPHEKENEYIIQMSTIGHARPTYGMHRAVDVVGEWIVSLHEDAHIIARKLRD